MDWKLSIRTKHTILKIKNENSDKFLNLSILFKILDEKFLYAKKKVNIHFNIFFHFFSKNHDFKQTFLETN